MVTWNPDLYLKYQDERTQPSYDLVSRINLAEPADIIDIGCGPGNSTRVLRERWPQAKITGLDRSPEMIARAQADFPQGNWLLADAATWETATRYDLVFSNATLQWIPNHEALVDKLFSLVRSGGALAVQVPANNGSPLYQAVHDVAARTEWRGLMVGCAELMTYHDAGYYYDLLSAQAGRVDLWQTTYYHVMGDHQGLIEWYASTGLRPYLERLVSGADRQAFQQQVLAACREQYPVQKDGRILFPFRRLFFIAYRD